MPSFSVGKWEGKSQNPGWSFVWSLSIMILSHCASQYSRNFNLIFQQLCGLNSVPNSQAKEQAKEVTMSRGAWVA